MIKRLLNSCIQNYRKKSLSVCGEKVRIGRNCHLQGQIYIGDNVSIGNGAYFVSTRAKLCVHDNVVFGPNVTVYTGDHPTDVVGKHLINITDNEKDSWGGGVYDQDVVISYRRNCLSAHFNLPKSPGGLKSAEKFVSS